MKKISTLFTLLFAMFICQNALAGSKTYYVDVTAEVAPECTGMGTVYLLDENDQQVSRVVTSKSSMTPYVDVPFVATPNEGYEFVGFMYDNGAELYDDGHYVQVGSISTDPESPSERLIYAYFKTSAPEDPDYHFSKTIYSATKFATVVLPVSFTLPEGVNAYYVDDVTDEAVVLTKLSDTVEEGACVLLENTNSSDVELKLDFDKSLVVGGTHVTGLLSGSFVKGTSKDYSYILTGYPTVYFNEYGFGYETTPFEPLLYVEEGEASYKIDTNVTTAINQVAAGKKAVQIFDANGRQINQLQKGINIVNGAKVIVK